MNDLEEARELTDGDNLYYRDSGKIRFFRVLKKQKRSVIVREVPLKKKGSGFIPNQERHNFIGASPTTLRLKGGEVSWKGSKLTLWPRGRPIKEDDLADGHSEVLMEIRHVSDTIIEDGPLTEKANVAVKAIHVISKMKDQDIYRKIVGGEGYPAKKGLSGLSPDEKKELSKQLVKAASRVVADGDMKKGEVKQTLAHIIQVFKRIRTKKSGAHYPIKEDMDDLFEAETSQVDDAFEELTEGYAKAGDEPEWDSMEAVFDKLMMDQDLSKEEMVDASKYLDMVTNSARGPWQNAPAKLPEPQKVTAGPQTEGLDEGLYRRSKAKQKVMWMKKFQKVATQRGVRGKIDWNEAHHYYYQGMGAEAAGMRYGKSHVKNTAAV